MHLALQQTLQLVLETDASAERVRAALGAGLDIAIVGDNDFYSQRTQLAARGLPPTTAALGALPRFLPAGVPIRDVHKTGLGSSAALTTSLVCGLLVRFGAVPRAALLHGAAHTGDAGARAGRRLAHNLAQAVHCRAQGKVGSGFDVSAAIFGSHMYTRFAPAVIQGLMSDEVRRPRSPSPCAQLARAYTECSAYAGNPGVAWARLGAVQPRVESQNRAVCAAPLDEDHPRRRRRGERHPVAGREGPQVETRACTGRCVGAAGCPRSFGLQHPVLLTAGWVTADRQWSELRNANAEVASVVQRLHALYGAGPDVYADGVRTAVNTPAQRVRLFAFSCLPDIAGVLIPTQWSSDSSEVVRLLGSLHAATEVCHLRQPYGIFQHPE